MKFLWNERKTELEHGLKETLRRDLSEESDILERKIFLDDCLSWKFQLSAR